MGEVIRGWRKLNDKELCKLYYVPDIITMMNSRRVGGSCGTDGREEKCSTKF
jgi:hypothetical protein